MAAVMTRRGVVGATAAALLPSASRADADPARRLTVAIPVGPDHFEPALTNTTAQFCTASNLFDSLLAYDYRAGMAVRPALAARWERVDDRALRLWLRPGVTFHDGSPMEAADVAWSLGPDHIMGPNRSGAATALATLEILEGVTEEAPDRVVVRARQADALLEARLDTDRTGLARSNRTLSNWLTGKPSWDDRIPPLSRRCNVHE